MSFDLVTSYKRPVLRPIVFPVDVASPEPSSLDDRELQEESQPWRVSTHTFVGTGDRERSSAWTPDRFGDDPALIPDDAAHDIPYDAASSRCSEGGFRLYSDGHEKGVASNVPSPRLVAKRYVPSVQAKPGHGKQGITLLMLPGMGAVKEMFEPMLLGLLPQLRKSGVRVEEIWTLDMPFCGETAQVNPMGYLYANEKDITRDILFFVTAYLPVEPGQELPSQLEARRPTSSPRQTTRQNLHVIAHSLGAQAAILASAHAPDIFSSLTVADPAMVPAGKINDAMAKLPKKVLCLGIPERYPSRAAVEEHLRTNKRTRGWDARAMRLFARHGVVPDEAAGSTGAVRLAARPRLEWALYYDKQTPAQCYDRLRDVSVPFHAIMPRRPFAVPPKMLETDVARLRQKTRLQWLEGATHQIMFEKTDACVEYITEWLSELAGDRKARL